VLVAAEELRDDRFVMDGNRHLDRAAIRRTHHDCEAPGLQRTAWPVSPPDLTFQSEPLSLGRVVTDRTLSPTASRERLMRQNGGQVAPLGAMVSVPWRNLRGYAPNDPLRKHVTRCGSLAASLPRSLTKPLCVKTLFSGARY
jgi:hypothetical protein